MASIPTQEGLAELDRLAREAASCVRPYFERMTMADYNNFLNMMYHYTRSSGDKMQRAAERSANPDLKRFFEHMFLEERSHYLLAEEDLRELRRVVNPATPRAVREFNEYWFSIESERCTTYIGALAVFENVARHAGDAVGAAIARLQIPKSQARWLLVHVQADDEHGRDALQMCERFLAVDGESLLAGARRACALWISIFRAAFEEAVELAPA